jgi:hypothetical protein
MNNKKNKFKWHMFNKSVNSIVIGIKKWLNINNKLKKYNKKSKEDIKVKLCNSNNKSKNHLALNKKIHLKLWI